MQRLTFDGVNDLFLHPRWGAVTKTHAAYLDELARVQPGEQVRCTPAYASDEMEQRNERCIDEHGVGMY